MAPNPRAMPAKPVSSSLETGGAYRDRTDDLKLAKLALSQLSYGPVLVELDKLYTRKGCCTGGPSRS